jgi:D-arabinose 1-dehydrogenase-like Zn-dependent alcohol dehydrogenase
MQQSLKAIRFEGMMSVIGFIDGGSETPNLLEALMHHVVVRGMFVGSRHQFEDMERAIEANDIHPVADKKTLRPEELREAY